MLRIFCELLKLIVKGTQVLDLFQCQIKYAFVDAQLSSINVHYVSNNSFKKLHDCRKNKPQTLNYDKCQRWPTCISCILQHCYVFQKITKFCTYTEDTWDQFYREYHRLKSTGTYRNGRSYVTFL